MKRTNSIAAFVTRHRRLLWLLLLPIVGCVGGLLLYEPLCKTWPAEWLALIPLRPVGSGFSALFPAWFSTCFQPLCLLLILFFVGLSAGGATIAVLIPLFWGLGFGMSEAYYAKQGFSGLLVIAVVLLPPAIVELCTLLMACSESLRLSAGITVQLLPRAAHCGGLWQDFRLFCARFLLFVVFILGAGALDVLIRLLLGGLLST